MYEYHAVISKIHDCDTVAASIDLGFGSWLHDRKLRLAGVSALELSMPGGKEATAHLAEILPVGSKIVIRSYKVNHDPDDDKSFERYVVVITLADGSDLGATLCADGWAVPWNGRTKPTPYPAWPRQPSRPSNGTPLLG